GVGGAGRGCVQRAGLGPVPQRERPAPALRLEAKSVECGDLAPRVVGAADLGERAGPDAALVLEPARGILDEAGEQLGDLFVAALLEPCGLQLRAEQQ